MALKILCRTCAQELDEPGAILLSPPAGVPGVPSPNHGEVRKYHLCKECWQTIVFPWLIGEAPLKP